MQFADPSAGSTAYLILRHLYDGDIIDWPIPDEHPQRAIFSELENAGYVARWDRTWPLHDRYRLTEKGIATIEAVYQPAGSEAFFEELRRQNLAADARRAYLQQRGLNPGLWPILHDPSTHWSTYGSMGGRYQSYVWADQRPVRLRRPPAKRRPPERPLEDDWARRERERPYLVDLDRTNEGEPLAPNAPDYDVS